MSDIQNAINQFFDNNDNWKECNSWGTSGIQAQIIADFEKSKNVVSIASTQLTDTVASAALRGINHFVPNGV